MQRQVNWILWSSLSEMALIVNPEEAEVIIALIHKIKAHPTHLLTYAAPVTRRMLHFNDLKYYALPEMPKEWKAPLWLKIELGIFAGRLYFEYDEYEYLCRFLGLEQSVLNTTETEDQVQVLGNLSDDSCQDSADEDATQPRARQLPTFTAKPLTFLQEWLTIRRKGQDFGQTPMGHVCQGKSPASNHPFFATRDDCSASKKESADKRNVRGQDVKVDEESFDEGGAFDEASSVDGYSQEKEDDFDAL